MTEDEARNKWCPFSEKRVFTAGKLVNDRCIASDCACWVDRGGDGRGNRLGRCGLIK